MPENKNIPIKEQFTVGSKGAKAHIHAALNEFGKLLFSFMCTDARFGSVGDPVSFNDIRMFYSKIRMVYDEVAFERIKSNIDFRTHVDRIGDEFERMSTHVYCIVCARQYRLHQTIPSSSIICRLNKHHIYHGR